MNTQGFEIYSIIVELWTVKLEQHRLLYRKHKIGFCWFYLRQIKCTGLWTITWKCNRTRVEPKSPKCQMFEEGT